VNIFALQKLLGHETLEMVRRYVELASDDVAEAHQKASPVDGWRL
jgi:site-specific recombinase XerD